MDREALLSKLSIRLSHLAETTNSELNKELDSLRRSLRDGINEIELDRISDRLARHLLLDEKTGGESAPATGLFAAGCARNIKFLEVDKSQRATLHKLADKLQGAGQLEQQLQILNDVFKVLQSAAPAASPKKSTSGGLLSWLDKKGGPDQDQLDIFLEKSSRLLDQAIRHIDVLNGNSKDTRALREQLEQPASVELLGEALEEVITLLKNHSIRIEEERSTTQDFLGDLRKRLSTVEQAILSVITDGDESLERAVTLEQQVGDDVRVMGKAVQENDLETLKQTVESGLTKLSGKVTKYLAVEKHSHEETRERVEDLNRKIRSMEEEARDLRGQIKDKQDLAVKDALTGVYNRAGYEQRVVEELSRSRRSNSPLSLVFVDCNKFKQINDTFGHAAGDIVLVEVAAALVTRARTSDIIARFGGDEFVAILPDTPVDGAEHFAKDACKRILNAGFNANGQPLDVSIACGITEARPEDTPDTVLQRADEAMYKAKKVKGAQVVAI